MKRQNTLKHVQQVAQYIDGEREHEQQGEEGKRNIGPY
jgi:hypothetical protein